MLPLMVLAGAVHRHKKVEQMWKRRGPRHLHIQWRPGAVPSSKIFALCGPHQETSLLNWKHKHQAVCWSGIPAVVVVVATNLLAFTKEGPWRPAELCSNFAWKLRVPAMMCLFMFVSLQTKTGIIVLNLLFLFGLNASRSFLCLFCTRWVYGLMVLTDCSWKETGCPKKHCFDLLLTNYYLFLIVNWVFFFGITQFAQERMQCLSNK